MNQNVNQQEGYQKGKGCQTALIKVTTKILDANEERKMSGLLSMDLSSAFDTVNWRILENNFQKNVETLRVKRNDTDIVGGANINPAVSQSRLDLCGDSSQRFGKTYKKLA